MKSAEAINRQKFRRVNLRLLRQVTHGVADLLGWSDYEIAVCLLDAEAMAELNRVWLNHEGSTDVITFDYPELPGVWRGEIFVSIPDAVAQAARFGRPWTEELARYVVHGALHLAGCDDLSPGPRRAMKRRENKLLKELLRRFDLRKLGL